MSENDEKTAESGDPFLHVRNYAKGQRERLRFDASRLSLAENQYVAWIDLMGAGHMMSVSIAKTANFLTRLHLASARAVKSAPGAVRTCPINDGIFFISPSKAAIMSIVREVVYTLASYFISTLRPHDKCLLRGALAFGPVYGGDDLQKGLARSKSASFGPALAKVQFGPAIIQAFRQEVEAPPYGIAIHESARAFAPTGALPFRETHWLWWASLDELPWPNGVVSLRDLARCLGHDLQAYFEWMKDKALFQGVEPAKIDTWAAKSRQYFSLA